MDLEECRLQLSKINREIGSLLKEIDFDESNIECDYSNLDQTFIRDQYCFIVSKLMDAYYRMEYLAKPVRNQGFIRHNADGRYELPSGEYFTSGDVCEILGEKFGEQAWFYTAIEHNGEDYYATSLGRNVSIAGKMVRIRR